MRWCIVLILTLSIASCKIKPPVNYADRTAVCMNEKDIMRLNQLCFHFELDLKQRYPELEIEDRYAQFLADLEWKAVPEQFFRKVLDKESFKKFLKKDTYAKVFDDKAYYDCAKEFYEQEHINAMIKDMWRIDGLVPDAMIKSLVLNLTPDDYLRDDVRLFIALQIHYHNVMVYLED